MNSLDEWLNLLTRYQQVLGKDSLTRLHAHMSGIEYSEKGERNHLPISESDFDLKALLTALHQMGCGGRILCESPIMEEDSLLMQKTWQSLSS